VKKKPPSSKAASDRAGSSAKFWQRSTKTRISRQIGSSLGMRVVARVRRSAPIANTVADRFDPTISPRPAPCAGLRGRAGE
jgi:hypothetical protein